MDRNERNQREAHRQQLSYVEALLRSDVPDAQLRAGLEHWAVTLRAYLALPGPAFAVTLDDSETESEGEPSDH